jgi:hypothetical protein
MARQSMRPTLEKAARGARTRSAIKIQINTFMVHLQSIVVRWSEGYDQPYDWLHRQQPEAQAR